MVYNTTMVKTSDIFKKIEERKKENKANQPQPAMATPPPATAVNIHHETVFQPAPVTPAAPVAPVVTKTKVTPPGSQQVKHDIDMAVFTECEQAYSDALALVQETMKEGVLYELIDIHRLSSILDQLIELARIYPGIMTELYLNPDMSKRHIYSAIWSMFAVWLSCWAWNWDMTSTA